MEGYVEDMLRFSQEIQQINKEQVSAVRYTGDILCVLCILD